MVEYNSDTESATETSELPDQARDWGYTVPFILK